MFGSTMAAARAKPLPVKPVPVEVADTTQSVQGIEGDVALFHTVKLSIKNLEDWVKKNNNDPSRIMLYVDGIPIKGLKPVLVENNTMLQFDLKRIPDNTDNTEAWRAILDRGEKHLSREVTVTAGVENALPVSSSVKATLTIIDKWVFGAFVTVCLFSIGLFWWMACKSDIIRNTGPQPEGLDKKGMPNRKPYSLARTQMALWFFVVIISYVFIWMVMKDLYILTSSVLALIGISAATGLGSAVVDSSKRSDQENQLRTLAEQKNNNEVAVQSLQSEISSLSTEITSTSATKNIEEQKAELGNRQAKLAAKRKEIDLADQQIDVLAVATRTPVSTSFINDILSDDNGISFHRFQIFTWTIVLIVIFIGSVYHTLAMPDFDVTLLGLMGISGGTYIGFKLPKQEG